MADDAAIEPDDGLTLVENCPSGTHPSLVDPELGAPASEAACEPDTTCDALSCGDGTCREEGGIAACVCPEGQDGDACDACAPGYAPENGECTLAAASPLPSPSDGLALTDTGGAQATISADGHRVQFGDCGSAAGCADEIPMTGRVSELFREVDIAVAQFVKTRCAGSAVVAFSRNDRRVYKRGFGKKEGAAAPNLAHCPNDDSYSPSALHTLPDTPHQIGSVSKFVTGAIAREQIWARIQERGLTGRYGDATEALLLDPDLELLPPSILRYLDQTRSDSVCPPVPTAGSCTRVGCGGNGPDARWQDITVGDLLGHTAGLAGSVFPSWSEAIVQAEATRNYNSESDWQADHDHLRATTKFPSEMDAARSNLAGKLSVSTDDIKFVSNRNALDDEDIYDETLKLVAGTCLSHDPVGQTQTLSSGVDQGYHNSSYRMLGRISAHLSGEQGDDDRFSAPNGFPELHEGSALDTFLLEHGLEDGVQAEHALETRVMGWDPSYPDLAPDRREWSSSTYSPTYPAENRPFCVWDGSTCDFSAWEDDDDNSIGLRLPWDFATSYTLWNGNIGTWVNSPPPVLAYRGTAARGIPTGALAAEAPALLRIANLYRAETKGVRQGALRSDCPTCTGTSLKSGSMEGARAHVRQMAGTSNTWTVPPRDVYGRLGLEPNTANWTPASWTDTDEVDIVTAVNQRRDEGGSGGYALHRYVSYALSRVDWDAVDREMDAESSRVVGMAMSSASQTYLWYADDHREVHLGTPDAFGHLANAPASVSLPSSRISSDIVGMAISNTSNTYAWYDDGHRSRGTSSNLDSADDVLSYSLPWGQSYEDIVAISIAADNRVYSWYQDGTRAIGRTWDLDAYGVGSYSLPPGQTAAEIEGIAIDWADGSHVYTRFRDGSVSEGTSYDLDRYAFTRGRMVGLSMEDGDTTQWFANGYMRRMSGTPADNMVTPEIIEAGLFEVAPGYTPSNVIAVSDFNGAQRRFWYSDGNMSYGTAPATDPSYPNSYNTRPNTLIGLATASNGRMYSWYSTRRRASGTGSDLDAHSFHTSFESSQPASSVAAIAIDSGAGGDGRVWTIYRDGAVSRGRSWNLGQQVWDAP